MSEIIEIKNLKSINISNGLNVICSTLSDSIISFVDYRKITPMNILIFLKGLNLPFEVDTDKTINYFMKLSETVDGGWYYHIRDYILYESRKTINYLRQRLIYLSDNYDISIDISFENGSNRYAVSYNFLHNDKNFMIKPYSDIMDCLDVLEVQVEEYLSNLKKDSNLEFQLHVANNYSASDLLDERE